MRGQPPCMSGLDRESRGSHEGVQRVPRLFLPGLHSHFQSFPPVSHVLVASASEIPQQVDSAAVVSLRSDAGDGHSLVLLQLNALLDNSY